MKKILALSLAILLALFNPLPAHAGTIRGTAVTSTLLDNSPTSVTGDGIDFSDSRRVAFFVVYDETEVGNSISAAVTLESSYDGTNWLSASFYDYAGGATLQTSETISADGRYYFWVNRDLIVPYYRVKIVGTNTDADDTALVSATFIAEQ